MVTVGSILGGTFRFVRNNLGAIAVWSGIVFLVQLLMMAAMQPFYAAQLAALQSGTRASPHIGAFLGVMLGMVLVFTALWAAAFRAVLFPAQSRTAYLRLGMDELRLLGCMLVLVISFYILALIAGVLFAVIGALIGSAAGFPRVVMAMAGLGIAGLVLSIWLGTRFSLAGPLTILERKIVIGPSWRLSRGNFWRLFGAYAVILILMVLLYGMIGLARSGPVLMDMMRPLDPNAQLRVATMNAANYALSIKSVIFALVSGVVGGFTLALYAGVAAVATDQLLGRRGEEHLSEVFE
ncbi:MAG TPA: hypothetical protein VK533_00845 [Sphingomonas sp.]|uniref:hypothetical protein n=1 Tax=Sphingomonas sp. TaxID=28214 RepID=UPI002BEB9128|nr:hypothetical protein [Sphingomonas sp.]HMI18066.1 hypothetical protein [Sphingomonas sp.]